MKTKFIGSSVLERNIHMKVRMKLEIMLQKANIKMPTSPLLRIKYIMRNIRIK